MSAKMPTTAFPQVSVPFAGWPNRDCKTILQLKEPLDDAHARMRAALRRSGGGGEGPEIHSDDADDGLGPYRGFHVKDREIGFIVFQSHLKSPFKGTDVVVDADTPVDAAIERVQVFLGFKAVDINWAHPTSKYAHGLAKEPQAVTGANVRPVARSPVPTVPLSKVAAELAEKRGMARKDAAGALDEFVGLVVRHLKKGNKVRLTGLGILQVCKRPARMGRNPATGEPIKIKASKKVAFRAAKDLKNAI